jgi:Planctomycete cytochrome C
MNRRMKGVPHPAMWALAGALTALIGLAGMASAAEEVSFKLDVQPILQTRCAQCHAPGGDGYRQSGLDLTSYEGLMKGTKHGPIVVPGDPFTSNLNVLIEGRASREIQMPHHQRPLLRLQQQIIADWVKQGAQNN